MFELYPPKKGKKGDRDKKSMEDEDDTRDGEDGWVEYVPTRMLPTFNPLPPQILLHADLQQIESKAYLFTNRQAGP